MITECEELRFTRTASTYDEAREIVKTEMGEESETVISNAAWALYQRSKSAWMDEMISWQELVK